MSSGSDQVAWVMHEAGQPGESAGPSELVALIAVLKNPMDALQDTDHGHELLAAFNKEFGFISTARYAERPLQETEQSRYASLVRWLIQELRRWRFSEDPEYRALRAALFVAQICDAGQGLWERLPDDIGGNSELAEYLKNLVARFAVEFTPRDARVPIWEDEAVEKFKQADAEGDWIGIVSGWKMFPPFFPISFKQKRCGSFIATAGSVSFRAWQIYARRPLQCRWPVP
jgi:hypothetical protein